MCACESFSASPPTSSAFVDRRAKSFSRSWSDPTPVKPESLHESRDSESMLSQLFTSKHTVYNIYLRPFLNLASYTCMYKHLQVSTQTTALKHNKAAHTLKQEQTLIDRCPVTQTCCLFLFYIAIFKVCFILRTTTQLLPSIRTALLILRPVVHLPVVLCCICLYLAGQIRSLLLCPFVSCAVCF